MKQNKLVFGSGSEAKEWLTKSGFVYVADIEWWMRGLEMAYMIKDGEGVKVQSWVMS